MVKMVKIRHGYRGLVYKNGKLVNYLKEGTHWLWGNLNVELHYMQGPLNSKSLADEVLANDLIAQDVNELILTENEIALVFKDGIYDQTLSAGRYLFWNTLHAYTWKVMDMTDVEMPKELSVRYKDLLTRLGFARQLVIEAGSKGVLMLNGQFYRRLAAGNHYFWANGERIDLAKTEMRWMNLEVNGQELLTLDKATIRVNVEAEYRVMNLEKALLENKDYRKQLYTAVQLELRKHVGALNLDGLLENKQALGVDISVELGKTAARLGLELGNVGIKDIILTGEMREIMNRVIIAEKEAQAGAILRREESAATRTMLNAAKLMEDNEMLYRLKEMEFVEKIADRVGEITISGNGGMVKQLKEIFAAAK